MVSSHLEQVPPSLVQPEQAALDTSAAIDVPVPIPANFEPSPVHEVPAPATSPEGADEPPLKKPRPPPKLGKISFNIQGAQKAMADALARVQVQVAVEAAKAKRLNVKDASTQTVRDPERQDASNMMIWRLRPRGMESFPHFPKRRRQDAKEKVLQEGTDIIQQSTETVQTVDDDDEPVVAESFQGGSDSPLQLLTSASDAVIAEDAVYALGDSTDAVAEADQAAAAIEGTVPISKLEAAPAQGPVEPELQEAEEVDEEDVRLEEPFEETVVGRDVEEIQEGKLEEPVAPAAPCDSTPAEQEPAKRSMLDDYQPLFSLLAEFAESPPEEEDVDEVTC